jgi:hypothetical protein
MFAKIFFIMLALSFLSLSFSSAQAFQNEPDGFREIKWGTRIDDLGNMKLQHEYDDGVAIYTRKGERLSVRKVGSIGIVRLREVKYFFYNDKFYKAIVEYDDSKASEIRKVLDSKYGNPSRRDTGQRSFVYSDNSYWNGNEVDIDFIHQTKDNYGDFVDVETSIYASDCKEAIAGRATVVSCIKYTYKPIAEMRSKAAAGLP